MFWGKVAALVAAMPFSALGQTVATPAPLPSALAAPAPSSNSQPPASSPQPGTPVVLTAPCSATDAGKSLRRCDDFVNGNSCITGLIANINSRVQAHINGYYGLYPDVVGGPLVQHPMGVELDATNPPGTPFGPTVCDLTPGPFVLKGGAQYAESATDHNGNSCGQPVNIAVSLSVDTVMGCAVDDPTVSTTIFKVNPQGTLEEGYFRGAMVQAITFYTQQMLQTIKTQMQNNQAPQITFSDINGAPSGCTAAAADTFLTVWQLEDPTQQPLQSLLANVPAGTALRNLTQCNLLPGTITCPVAIPPPGSTEPTQMIEQGCSAQIATEAAFTASVVCQIFAQAQGAYIQNIWGPSGHLALTNTLNTKVVSPCVTHCTSQFYDPSAACHTVPSDSDVSNCVNTCYQANFTPAVAGYIGGPSGLWPPSSGGGP